MANVATKRAKKDGSLKGWHPLRMVIPTAQYAGDFPFSVRLVYSYLIYCKVHRIRTTVMGCARTLGMKRDTIRQIRDKLAALGLLNHQNMLRPPPDGMFVPIKNAKARSWLNRLAYHSVLFPASKPEPELDFRASAVYGFFLAKFRRGELHRTYSARCIGKCLGMEHRTVDDRLDILDRQGLLVRQRDDFGHLRVTSIKTWNASDFSQMGGLA